MNAVVVAVALMLLLSLLRVHVVVSLIIGAVAGGLLAGLGIESTLAAFNKGLGGGATVALSYALLGAFAVAISKSGVANALAEKILKMIGQKEGKGTETVKWMLIMVLLVAAISSQNILPIHIAFIPLLVPPLLYVMGRLQLDRRLVACVLTFGLITPYMFLPVGFGGIFLKEVLLANVAKGGVDVTGLSVMQAMMIPAAGMLFGLLVAILLATVKNVLISRWQGPCGFSQQQLQSEKFNCHWRCGDCCFCCAVVARLNDYGGIGWFCGVFSIWGDSLERVRRFVYRRDENDGHDWLYYDCRIGFC